MRHSSNDYDVVFAGWQPGFEDIKSFPLFNVIKPNHARLDSTLSILQ